MNRRRTAALEEDPEPADVEDYFDLAHNRFRRAMQEPAGLDDDIELQQNVFTDEHFKRMILRTFIDYHPGKFNIDRYILDDFLGIVREQAFSLKYGQYLDGTSHNVLNIKNMPWLDIGDLPESYDRFKEEVD